MGEWGREGQAHCAVQHGRPGCSWLACSGETCRQRWRPGMSNVHQVGALMRSGLQPPRCPAPPSPPLHSLLSSPLLPGWAPPAAPAGGRIASTAG